MTTLPRPVGRHRDDGVRTAMRVETTMLGVWAWSGVLVVLGTLFVMQLALDFRVPDWLRLTLGCVPGICVISVGLHAMMLAGQRCECKGGLTRD